MISKDRNYKSFEVRAADDKDFSVTGYAATFNLPTVLYEYEGIQYKEVISRGAFDGAIMQDVVMNYNHSGKPVARTKNNTLLIEIDNVGLKITADLSGTKESRDLYEEIKGGYIDKMSFAFIVAEDGSEYEKLSHTRNIKKFKRIYDVAAVDIPAYESTSIQARSFFEAEAEKETKELVERRKQKLRLKLKLEEI
jgi:HK97 family phage prohead protease